MLNKNLLFLIPALIFIIALGIFITTQTQSSDAQVGIFNNKLDNLEAHPPLHVKGRPDASTVPTGLSPAQIKQVYKLPATGGTGTIAIIDAYDDPNAANDLNIFSQQFNLPLCNATNPCFEKHKMTNQIRVDAGWVLEESLDIEWAHAIAPNAKILLVEARSAKGTDLLNAVNYARSRPDVVAISMSWGMAEFSGEASYDTYFTTRTNTPITFFASSGDSGAGVQWPAVSSNVTGVGGTNLSFTNGVFSNETAWNGSGGGLSAFESQPSYQSNYGVPQAAGKRAVPDVSYVGGSDSPLSVYDSTSYSGQSGWFAVYGTSAGAPQWAAIRALNSTVMNSNFYADATSNYSLFFRDILVGSNGTCGFYCTATSKYDYVTGLGSPISISF